MEILEVIATSLVSRGNNPDKDVVLTETDLRRGEYLCGFIVKGGSTIHGIQLLTSLGQKSRVFGNPYGGSRYVMAGITRRRRH